MKRDNGVQYNCSEKTRGAGVCSSCEQEDVAGAPTMQPADNAAIVAASHRRLKFWCSSIFAERLLFLIISMLVLN